MPLNRYREVFPREVSNLTFAVKFFVVLILSIGSAQIKSDERSLFDLSLEELLEVEVEVSNRNPTSLIRSPSSVSVYSRNELQRMGVRSLDELLNFVPGYAVSRTDAEGRSNAPTIRGRRSNSVGREILVLLDGIRLNDPVTGGIFSQERSLSLINVKQVEVIRGPGSTLYGANAFSGVVNIITDTEDTFLEVRGGSFDAAEGTVMLSQNEDDWGVTATIYHYKDNGDDYDAFYDFFGVTEETQDPERLSDVYVKAHLDSFSFVFRRNERSSADFIIAGGQAKERQRHRVENRSLRLMYDEKINHLHTSWFAEYSESDTDSLFALFPESPSPPLAGNPFYWSDGSTIEMLGGNVRTVEQQRYGLDARLDTVGSHTVNFGALYRKESVSLNPFQSNIDVETVKNMLGIVPTPQDDFIQTGFYIAGERFDLLEASDRESIGVYLQDSWDATSDIVITSGLRYDNYQDFGGNFSFRAGLVDSWDDNTTFKLLYGDAFRAPSFIETRAGIATGGISNPDLKPEKVKTYEFSWIETYQSLSSVLTLFHNQYRDLVEPVLVSDVVQGFTAFQPQNKASEETNGVEWEVSGDIFTNTRLRGGLSRMFKKITMEPVGDTSFFIVGNYQLNSYNVNMSAYYHDDVVSRPATNVFLDSYWISNIALRYALLPQLELSLDIHNVFNQSYQTWSPQTGLEEGLPGRGRSILVGIKLTGL